MVNSDEFDVGAALDALITRSSKQKKLLAEHMNVSEQAVQKWIRQGTIAREHIRKLCLYLGCSADELLGIRPIEETAQQGQSHPPRLDQNIIRGVARAMQDISKELNIVLTTRQAVEVAAELYERVGEGGVSTADVVWLIKRMEQGA
jgi:DNA-binding Xre family transcriptional regulator